MRRADDLQAYFVSGAAVKRRRHLRHERDISATVRRSHVDEDLGAEILDRPDLRAERPFADLQ